MAGLVAYYNRHQFYYLCLALGDDGARRLYIQSSDGTWPEGRLSFPVDEGIVPPDGPLRLALDIVQDKLQFRWATPDGDWRAIGPALDASILSDEGGRGAHASFTGNLLGMAAHDLSGHGHVADFGYFHYRETEAWP